MEILTFFSYNMHKRLILVTSSTFKTKVYKSTCQQVQQGCALMCESPGLLLAGVGGWGDGFQSGELGKTDDQKV